MGNPLIYADKLSEDELGILLDYEEEYYRKGMFERIFPNKNNIDVYEKFFETSRNKNDFLWGFVKQGATFAALSKHFKVVSTKKC
jgi:hypothetical protein